MKPYDAPGHTFQPFRTLYIPSSTLESRPLFLDRFFHAATSGEAMHTYGGPYLNCWDHFPSAGGRESVGYHSTTGGLNAQFSWDGPDKPTGTMIVAKKEEVRCCAGFALLRE